MNDVRNFGKGNFLKYINKMECRKKKIAAAGICFSLAVIFLIAGTYFFHCAAGFFQNITIQSEEGISPEWLSYAFRAEDAAGDAGESGEETFSFAAWTELKNESVSTEFGKGVNADVAAVYGPSCCVLPVGKNLDIEDTRGCILGGKLAESLFGSHQAEGQKLIWRDQTWIVRGVVKEPSDFLMVQASGMDEPVVFDRISIAAGRADDRRLKAEDFINSYGLSARVLRWDYLYGISWTEELIPGEWSDFDGWKQNIKTHKQAVKMLRTMERSSIEDVGLRFRQKGNWLGILGIICCGAGVYAVFSKR